ncbi:hypothetical protein SAMN00808754_2016 [Thermanaeromonas toyohensis ToBE]|uniref:Uncharacterized protein n=1 Tax=Thermanaeromonas toyohensis ToBE TaxID=698762 RepID=A0A1W1VYG8_9FIRM|nr:hypothetical protein [Thermanaeromonas toyohensis]SMB97894.1 hypothetical protein SAMN00808754_2016 [Thermanaeromonas toyohensis ToBE]
MRPAVHILIGILVGWLLSHLWGYVKGNDRDFIVSPALPALSPITSTSPSPFDTIYYFYKAVEEGNEEKVRELVTPELWSHLKEEGFLQQWQARKNMEPGLRFVLFLVAEQNVDEEAGRAWARGQAEWDSPRKGIISSEETIRLLRFGNTWKIAAIESESPVYTADEFYRAIQRGDWNRVRSLVDPDYWRRLSSAGIISALKKDRQASSAGVYLVFYINDYGLVDKDTAWVQGDVIWHPLTTKSFETPATLSLRKTRKGWIITHIAGHWEIRK